MPSSSHRPGSWIHSRSAGATGGQLRGWLERLQRAPDDLRRSSVVDVSVKVVRVPLQSVAPVPKSSPLSPRPSTSGSTSPVGETRKAVTSRSKLWEIRSPTDSTCTTLPRRPGALGDPSHAEGHLERRVVGELPARVLTLAECPGDLPALRHRGARRKDQSERREAHAGEQRCADRALPGHLGHAFRCVAGVFARSRPPSAPNPCDRSGGRRDSMNVRRQAYRQPVAARRYAGTGGCPRPATSERASSRSSVPWKAEAIDPSVPSRSRYQG